MLTSDMVCPDKYVCIHDYATVFYLILGRIYSKLRYRSLRRSVEYLLNLGMLRKALYTKKLGKEVANRAKGGIVGKYHVIPSKADKWGVVSEGSVKPIKAFRTKAAAVTYIKKRAASSQIAEVVIHSPSGQILDTVSFK